MSKLCKDDKNNSKDKKRIEGAFLCKKCGNTSQKEKKLCKPTKNK